MPARSAIVHLADYLRTEKRMLYIQEMLGTAVFAITGVLAIQKVGVDLFGAIVLGIITAIGGGTIRDLLLDLPIFWIADFNYIWVALFAALLAFFLTQKLQQRYRLLLYLDGFAAALFGLVATEKVVGLELAAPLAVMMGLLTSIGGGIARDVLAGRASLLMSREIYATPILLGCTLYVVLRDTFPSIRIAGWIALIFTSGLRFLAIYKDLQMPVIFTTRRD
ncbi:trimeric intracellular cation channel family protein [Pseudomonas akapageensis]|uniref:trimeric intracellular cation channel family protein n=1 Tax=Pseudomonas akapageensis TaxID=2609961 RepID=UPI0031B5F146